MLLTSTKDNNMDFATMSFDELMAHSQPEAANSVPQSTIAYCRDAPAKPVPQATIVAPLQMHPQWEPTIQRIQEIHDAVPAAIPVPEEISHGRPKHKDPTDPAQLHAIARRMPTYIWNEDLGHIGPVPFTRLKATLLAAKSEVGPYLASIATIGGVESLVLGA